MKTIHEQMPEPEHAPPSAVSAEFQSVFTAEFDFVCRMLRRLGVREADMKDVAQELFLSVYARLHEFDGQRQMRSWLSGFAIRFAANYRKLARHRYEEAIDSGSDFSDSTLPNLEARDLLYRALDAIDFDRRTVVVMHDFEGFDAAEIAASIGVPVNTVYTRIRLGREDLRTSIGSFQRKGIV